MGEKEVLIKAKELLIERGVNRKGWFWDDDEDVNTCALCTIGAIYVAGGRFKPIDGKMRSTDHGEIESGYYRAVERVHRAKADQGGVPSWNDATETDEEVISFFDEMIEAAS